MRRAADAARRRAPVNGFRDARDYCASAACGPYLRAIRRPALIVHALDDPFLDARGLPCAGDLSHSLRLELSVHGGHAGLVAGDDVDLPRLWLEERVPQYLRAVLAARFTRVQSA